MSLPHIRNSKAGVNRQDPVYKNMYEVYFTLPQALQAEFGADIPILTEQVQKVSGLDTLTKGPTVGQQKFMGTDRSYLQSKLDQTFHTLEFEVALNLRNRTDNYIYKLLKAWNKLGYDISTGETVLKADYVADWCKIVVANRAGDIIRKIIFKDVMMSEGITGFDELNYTDNEVATLTFKLVSDWAEDIDA